MSNEPRTEAGRALLEGQYERPDPATGVMIWIEPDNFAALILAIEDEARAEIDVERLALALHDEFCWASTSAGPRPLQHEVGEGSLHCSHAASLAAEYARLQEQRR